MQIGQGSSLWPGKRAVALAGGTGLVGRSILEGLLADPSVHSVHVLARRKPRVADARITSHIVDFAALPPLPPVDEVYLALGTTIKVAGSQAAFRAIDFDANLAVARVALAAGARRCGLVSAMGANAKSGVFYNRVKGELEEALAQLPFEGLVIARPSLLVGDRVTLGQPGRPLEKVGEAVSTILGPLIPANYRPIAAAQVARALLARTPSAEGRIVVPSGEMQRNQSKREQQMSKAIESLQAAQKHAMTIRPKVGGFPYLAEALRRAGVTRNIWSLPACQSIFLTDKGPVVMQGQPLVSGAADIPAFDRDALIKALRIDQAGESTFPEFLAASWRAGVVRYDVDFEKRSVS